MATIDEIKQQAEAVKNATQVGENTALRVGGVLVDLCEWMKNLSGTSGGSGVSLGTLLTKLNSDNPFPTINGQVLTYNGSNFIWKTPTGSGVTLSAVMSAMNDQLGKTSYGTPQFLYWTGSKYTWKNESEISGGSGSSSRIKKIKLFNSHSDYSFETIDLGTADTIGFMAGDNVTLGSVVKEYTNVIKISATGGSSGGSSGGSVSWENVTGKPSTFTPSSHTHSTSEISGLNSYVKGTKVSNASAADRLANAVTLWGNNFSGNNSIGTSSAYADLKYVKNIYAGDVFDIKAGNNSLLKVDGTPYIYVGLGYMTNNDASILLFGNKTTICTSGDDHRYDFKGDVFDVNTNAIHFGYTSSGGKISWDTANNAFKIEGNVYATGGITALGVSNSATTSNNVDFTFKSVTAKKNTIYASDDYPFEIYPRDNTDSPLIFSNAGTNWNIYDDGSNDIHLQSFCRIDSDGWVFSPQFLSNENGSMSLDGSNFTLGGTDNNVNVLFYYNGSRYILDMSKAISIGVFTKLSTQELSTLQERKTKKKAVS